MQRENHGQATQDTEAEERGGWLTRVREKWSAFLASRAGRGAIPAFAVLAVGFLFARTPLFYGAYPLGLALLCANRRQTLPCFLGVCLGAATLGLRGLVYGILYMLALLLRLLFSLPQGKGKVLPKSSEPFGELPQMQVVGALVVSAAAAVYELAVSFLDLSTALFSVTMLVGAPLMTSVFSGFFSFGVTMEDVLGRRRTRVTPHARGEKLRMEFAVVAILFFCVFGLREVSVFGLNFGLLLSAFAALYLARRFGALRGCVAGLIVGMAGSTLYAPAFGFLGLLTGALWPLGAVYAMGLGAAAGTVWSSFVGGLSGFLDMAPELWVATLISLPLLPRLYSDAIAEEVQKERAAAEEAVRAVSEREGDADRITRLSDAFEALSRTFSERSLAPAVDRCFAVCDEICTGYCAACPNRVGCWDSDERPASVALGILAERISRGQTFTAGDMPTRLLTDCNRLESLLDDVRVAGARLWREQRRCAGADYPSPDYALTAELLREAADSARHARQTDAATAQALRRQLSEHGIRPAAVSVRGERRKRIVIGSNALSGKQREAAALIGAFETACGCRLTPARFETNGEVITMETHTAEQFALEVAYASRPAAGSEVSGDIVSIFRSAEGYSYILLSDGMGTGRTAARTAGVCALFLEKMLSAGNSQQTSLKMLNHLVSVREEECAATIDLLEFDNCYGHAGFMKSGAAASYVRRDGNLFRMRSRTIPLGIVGEVDAECTRFETREGDIIIMLSDGVSQTSEDAPWLIELLSRPLGASLENAANTILDRTVENGGAVDDMTVILARVVKTD